MCGITAISQSLSLSLFVCPWRAWRAGQPPSEEQERRFDIGKHKARTRDARDEITGYDWQVFVCFFSDFYGSYVSCIIYDER